MVNIYQGWRAFANRKFKSTEGVYTRPFHANPPNSGPSTLQTHKTRSTCVTSLQIRCSRGKEQLAGGKKLVIGGGYKDSAIAVSISNGALEFTEPLACSHEEADTRSRVIIESPDTDVLVLCITHFESIGCEGLWFKNGVRDHLRYVPVHRLSEKLGQKLCRCLPAFHALTGCDTTSALAGVSKKKNLNWLDSRLLLMTYPEQRAKCSSATYTLQLRSKLAVQTNCDMSCFVRSNTRVNSYLLLQTVYSSMQDKSATKPSSGEMLW